MRISDWSSDVCSSDLAALDETAAHDGGRFARCLATLRRNDQFDRARHRLGDRLIDRSQRGLGETHDRGIVEADDRKVPGNFERSEERLVGEGGVRMCRSRWWPGIKTKKEKEER